MQTRRLIFYILALALLLFKTPPRPEGRQLLLAILHGGFGRVGGRKLAPQQDALTKCQRIAAGLEKRMKARGTLITCHLQVKKLEQPAIRIPVLAQLRVYSYGPKRYPVRARDTTRDPGTRGTSTVVRVRRTFIVIVIGHAGL